MKIISIDIGIKNLAYVILEQNTEDNKHFDIIKWDTINLCNKNFYCSNNGCKKPAKFVKENHYYCKQHAKNVNYKIPTINIKTLHKQNMKNLTAIATENSIDFEKNIHKANLIKLIEDRVHDTCLDVIETFNANNINLIDLGINMKTELNELFSNIDLTSIDQILLENQIGPIANRMKTIQGMLAQYFINYNNHNIQFISAMNKLKLFAESKRSTYTERKKMGIKFTQELLIKKNMHTDYEYFNNHTKKDDLADSLLQGLYYLNVYNKLEL
jgi:hypothetical protein